MAEGIWKISITKSSEIQGKNLLENLEGKIRNLRNMVVDSCVFKLLSENVLKKEPKKNGTVIGTV